MVGIDDGERVRLAQNWDWHPAQATAMVVWTIPLPGGGWMTTITEAGMLAKLGVNSHGVAVGLNFLTSTLDGGTDGLPVHALLRMVLDSCGSATEALGLLLAAPVRASASIAVAAASRPAARSRRSSSPPPARALVWPDAAGRLVHTNHFLAEPGRRHEAAALSEPSTLLRHRHLTEALGRGTGAGGRAALALPPAARRVPPRRARRRVGGAPRDAAVGRHRPGRAHAGGGGRHALRPAPRRRGRRPMSFAVTVSVDVDGEAGLPGGGAGESLTARSERRHGLGRGLERVLGALEEVGATGTFYVPGAVAQAHPGAVAAILAAGHELGHHGHEHLRPDAIDAARQRDELERGSEALCEITGEHAGRLPRAGLGDHRDDARAARRARFQLGQQLDGGRSALPRSTPARARSGSCRSSGRSTTRPGSPTPPTRPGCSRCGPPSSPPPGASSAS